MAQIVKELRVDVSQPNVFQAIVAKQHDSNSRFLKITLVDFGVKVEVPNTAKVTINANRPDGASESFKGEANNDGTITVPLAQWMLDIDGEVKCDVSVTNTEDNKRLTSTDFWLEVQKAANPNASIPLDPDGEILIIKPVTEINENSKDADYPSAKAVYDYGQSIAADTQITATATGNAITIESSQAPLQNLKLYGKTTQNGTPTPDAPVPLVSVGDSGSFGVGVYGKNFGEFEYSSGSADWWSLLFAKKVHIPKGSNVTISVDVEVASATKVFWNSSSGTLPNTKVETLTAGKRRISYSFTTQTEINRNSDIWLSKSGTGDGVMVTCSNAQLEFGSVATPYEPCNKQSLTMTYTLRSDKAGNLKDIVDLAKGVYTQKVYAVDLSTITWKMPYTSIFSGTLPQTAVGNSYNAQISNIFCTHYKPTCVSGGSGSGIGAYGGEDKCISLQLGTSVEGISVVDTTYTDLASFKASLSGVYLVYPLATPIETPLTETELNAYRQLYTNKGNTTILSEAEMEVDYYINKPNAQAIGNIHTQVNKDYLKLQQAIISTGGSTL